MKKLNFSKITKILCWIAFFLFYLLSIETSGILNSGDRNTILYGIFLTLTVITILVITALYAKNKKFSIIISAYFLVWLIATVSVMQMNYYLPDVIIVVFAIIYYSFWAPFMGLETYIYVDKLSKIFDDIDYAVYTLFVLVVILVYAVYFISRKLQMNKIKCEISEKVQKIVCENFNKAISSWKEECPEEAVGISDNELNEKGLTLKSLTKENKFLLCAEFCKKFSNGDKAVYIVKFKGGEVFDDVFYLERA